MKQNEEVAHPLNPDLRRLAEDEVSEKERATSNISDMDVRALYHELQVHQVELEMQNEELRRVQADLASSEEKYRDLYEFAPVGYLTIEPSGKILEANLTAASIFGTERVHLLNNRFHAYISQSSIPEFNSFCRHVMESGAKQTAELQLNCKGMNGRDHHWVLIESRATTDCIHHGFWVAVIDITEHKLLDKIINSLGDPLFVKDRNHRFIRINDALCNMMGHPCEEVIGRTDHDFFPMDQADVFWERDEEVFESGQENVTDEKITDVHGMIHDITTTKTLYRDPSGNDFLVGTIRDTTERKKVVEALKESEELYRRLFEVESDAIFLVDCESNEFIDANPATLKMYGYSREEILMIKANDISAQPAKTLQAIAAREERIPLRWHHRKDGTVFPVEIAGSYFDYQGRLIHVAAIRDITARKNIEARLKQSESRYHILFKHSPIPSLEEDYSKVKSRFDALRSSEISDFRKYFHSHPEEVASLASMAKILDINQKGREFFRIAGTEYIPSSRSGCFTDSSYEVFIEELAALAEGNTRFESEAFIRTRGGDNKTISLNLSVVPGFENTLSRVQVSFVDITERRQAEKALQDNEEKYRLVVENANEGIILAQDGFIKFANRGMAKLLGRIPDEITARPFQEFIYPDDRAMVAERYKRRTAGEQIEDLYAFRIVTGDGSMRWVEISVVRIEWQGHPATLNFLSDITERKRADESRDLLVSELESKNAEMERFIYTVSHDLKSPLVSICGLVGFLKSDLQNGNLERVDADLNVISGSVTKMDLLLRDTLELSRIGRVASPPEIVSFEEAAREALSQMVEKIRTSGIEVKVAPGMPPVNVDRMRILEVLTNLIENSIKYRGDQTHPEIEIGYRQDDGAFFVKDNGIGIDPSQHDKVFELFYKMDRKSEGTGAGLAIVKRIIEVHGGRIWIESDLGKGCMVCFTLPRDKKM